MPRTAAANPITDAHPFSDALLTPSLDPVIGRGANQGPISINALLVFVAKLGHPRASYNPQRFMKVQV
ncbi:uncharacterized protein ARMOST_12072 [Armillaria ostoyae]|uniref:Uncharacterized protein n=1 Tax=Armillaria ostoyae TaxID=47428 RepID=A0A284RIZ2_ARMOS|nr:uncharacterized protein ARMOST_12072 [Armillaria ostoyae]